MGTSYTAYAIIGVVLEERNLYREEKVSHAAESGHNVPEGALYCPQCGKSATTTDEVPIYDEDNGFGLFFLLRSWDNDRVVLGYGPCERDYFYSEGEKDARSKSLPNVYLLYDELRDALTPLGLWTEKVQKSFGLHAVLHIS